MTLQNHTCRRAEVQDRLINREQKDHWWDSDYMFQLAFKKPPCVKFCVVSKKNTGIKMVGGSKMAEE